MYQSLEPFLDHVISLAKQECASFCYGVDKFQAEVPSMVDRLAKGVLPNEVEKWNHEESRWDFSEPSLAGILNAAWIYHLSAQFWGEHETSGEKLQEASKLFGRMVDKAVELAEVERLWKGNA